MLDRGNLVYVAHEGALQEHYTAFKQELFTLPGIEQVSASGQNPLNVTRTTDEATWEGKDPDNNTRFRIINANHDLSRRCGWSWSPAARFRRQAAVAMGEENPVGETLEFWGRKGEVIGIVRDFHNTNLSSPIEPTIIRLDPSDRSRLWVRMKEGQVREGVSLLRPHHELTPRKAHVEPPPGTG